MKEWLHRILRNDQIKGRQFRSQGMIEKKKIQFIERDMHKTKLT